jgi:Helix-turn-helix domain
MRFRRGNAPRRVGGQINRETIKNMGNFTEQKDRQSATGALAREWLDLRGLTEYAAVCERTVRSWIHSPVDPLPAARIGGKILVRKSNFDHWLERHRMKPADALDLDGIVREVVEGVSSGR